MKIKNTKYNLLNEIFILKPIKFLWHIVFLFSFSIPLSASANDHNSLSISNFWNAWNSRSSSGWRLPDGEIVLTQQIHKRLARSGISFQALPQVGFSFRYSGHGKDGHEAYGRRNHDRSFDIHS